jgi:diguanylate cyclase (GGDEF)-like protein
MPASYASGYPLDLVAASRYNKQISNYGKEVITIRLFPYTELNIFCLAILILIYFNVRHRREQMTTEQKLFLMLIIADALILILDSLMWLLDGKPGLTARTVYSAVTALYYVMNPVICAIWYFYTVFQIYRDMDRLRRLVLPVAVPVAVNAVFTVCSIFNGALFYFDAGNVYHRGPLFLIMVACAFFCLIFAWVLTVAKRKMLPKHDFFPIAAFMFFPFIGGAFQALFYGISVVWPSTTVAILIIFVNIQNIQLYTDHLTGLYNRRQLDRYLPNRLQNVDGQLLAGLMIDVDSFKHINDSYGHSAGDQALVDTSEILKATFRKNDFVSRFGGDEFVVIMAVCERADLQKAIDRLHKNVMLFNERKTAPYTIRLSVGYDCYFDGQNTSAKEFLSHLDDLMYRDKHSGI